MELVGLPEKPVPIGDGGKIGAWNADALRKNIQAVRADRVYTRRIDQRIGTGGMTEEMDSV